MIDTTYADRWGTVRLALLFSENGVKNSDGQYSNAYQFLYGNIVPKKSYELTEDLLETYRKYTVVQPDDIMLNGLNLNYDFVTQRVASVKETGIITSAYICIRPNEGINAPYYTYLLKSLDARKVFHGMGTGIRLTLSWNSIKNLRLPVPSRAEQDQIVRFLGWKTSKINRLINTYRKEIDRIIELKNAIISQTVTRGLNPKVQMKYSGTDWLGNIPRHWELMRGKLFFTTKKQINKENVCSNVLSLTLNGVINNDKENPIGLSPEDYSTYQIFEKNDLVFKLIDLENISTSRVGLVHEKGIMSSAYIRLTNRYDCNVKYFYYYYYEKYLRNIYNGLGTGVRSTLSASDLLNLPVCIPPRDEQDQIVEFLDKKASAFQRVIDALTKKIELLREYKNRLISDVVTGQIDVRDVEIPEYERVEEIAEAEPENEEAELEEAESEVS